MAKAKRRRTISRKITSILVLIGVIFALILFLAAYIGLREAINRDAESLNFATEEIFNTIIRRDTAMLSSNLVSLSAVESLRKDFQDQDRETLYADAKPIFEKNKEKFGITHMYFIGLDGKVFLRVHEKNNFGDEVKRTTFKEAQKTKDFASGIELGKTAYALRAVAPYYDKNGAQIGYLELGQEIDHFISDLSLSTGQVYAVLGDKDYLKQTDYEATMKDTGLSWDGLKKVVLLSKESKITSGGPCLIDSEIDIKDLDINYRQVSENGQTYICSAMPIRDKDGIVKGALISKNNVTEAVRSINRQTFWISLGSLLGFGLLIFLISQYLDRIIIRPLKYISTKIPEISKKKDGTQIEYDGNDEISDVSDAVNSMSVDIKDYGDNLENKVDERTEELERTNKAMVGRELKMIELKKTVRELEEKLNYKSNSRKPKAKKEKS